MRFSCFGDVGKGQPLLRLGFVVLWLALLGTGFLVLGRYSMVPGEALATPEMLPLESLETVGNRPLLIIALHPQCPCSRASLGELNRLLSRAPGQCEPIALFYKAEGESDSWVETELYRSAKQIGCSIVIDEDGVLAGRLGMLTSGHVAFYDEQRRLQFSGGITASRGHEGDNSGSDQLLQLLRHERKGPFRQPVFGCALGSSTGGETSLP